MARNPKLTDKQLAVLRWVADGRPEGVYEDGFAHRITARALVGRGLLTVRGHGPSWQAALTTDGRYYIEHGDYPPSTEAATPKAARVRVPPTPPKPVPIEDLLERLEAASGVLTLEAPTDADRVSYRRAVEELRASGELAAHQRLKITGVKSGVLRVELVTDPVSEGEVPKPQIPVPDAADARRPEIRALAASPELLPVSDDTRPRALALMQAIADECARRGWTLTVGETSSFIISVGEDEYACALFEEREKRDIYTDEDLAARKYDWQRVSLTRQEVWTGRLRLEFGPRYVKRWWADRKRWTLASKLPEFFAAIDEKSATARNERARYAAAHQAAIEQWELAVPQARERYLRAHNAQRAQDQIEAWKRATDLRNYAAAIELEANRGAAESADSALAWAAWLRGEADRTDPLFNTAELAVDEPKAIAPGELDKFMPRGWTVRRPPDPPRWLPP